MSSFHSCGLSWMKSCMSLMHVSSCSSLTSTPRERTYSPGPWKVLFSPTTIVGMQHSSAAHVARTQRRVERGTRVVGGRESSGVLEAVHLGVQHGTATLNAAVVAARSDFVVDLKHRADGDAPLAQAQLGLVNCSLEKRVHGLTSIGLGQRGRE
ncbi:hypothetical protein GN958_ATG09203 [Phytophthora infestans]|uniref:Uncharacterized protein n=1 Tax=Phytophthora infestans TaxID=4787 RepID=A0A8S9U978_PHYIN|nr:hypothetical protein GN958_ATG14964 [Phytophthora infestans]KAF4141611.1 hypothetical protein GN958_ATG09203 [Phytophthora infestans]